MHVRIHQGENSIDVINLYQHVWRSQLDKDSNTKCREGVWKKLRQVTTKIPQRNTLVVGGDFNCTIRRMRHHIGSAIVEAREPSPAQKEFLGYLQDHGMTLLNTWHAKPAYTCQTGDSQTQIDFLLCREQHADKTAKDSKPWHQAPIVQRESASRPFPCAGHRCQSYCADFLRSTVRNCFEGAREAHP